MPRHAYHFALIVIQVPRLLGMFSDLAVVGVSIPHRSIQWITKLMFVVAKVAFVDDLLLTLLR